jgi:hypothetical protein
MSEHDGLIARLEAATGPNRELDAEIAVAARFFPQGVGFVWQSGLTPNSPEPGRVECMTSLGTGGPHYAAPRYTDSIDVALTLVLPGLVWSLYSAVKDCAAQAQIEHPDNLGAIVGDGQGKAPALALCIAALRARSATP